MRALWNSFKIAFSMYSKIPMPMSDWSKENMKYVFGFFPVVGAVVGILLYGAACLMEGVSLPPGQLFRVAVLTALPILITGGIHLDGFLDTSDALSSWQEKERRLEILKDSHAGAFAIICAVTYMTLYAGAVSVLESRTYLVLIFFFIGIRAASGLSVVHFPKAKHTGLAATFSDGAHKKVIEVWMLVYLALCVGAAIFLQPVLGGSCTVALLGVFLYYRWMSEKYFGGINGDLAGWFLQMAELFVLLAAAVLTLIMGGSIWN